jgi:penicillin-binding protein 1B
MYRFLPWTARVGTLRLIMLVVSAVSVITVGGIVVDAVIRVRLNDPSRSTATRVYARPVVLVPGASANREQVAGLLQRLGYREVRGSRVAIGEYHLGTDTWVIGRRAFRHYDTVEPGGVAYVRLGYDNRIWSIEDDRGPVKSVILEPELLSVLSARSQDRVPVPLADMPPHLVDAVLAVEDQRFFEHEGLDLWRIGGAAMANVRAGRIVQGASTVSQQLMKNLFLSARRTPMRKFREMVMATVLELRYTKEEILEAYLNEVYLGQDGGLEIRGVGRAAQYYFGRDVSQIDLNEAALLAGLIRGPNLYEPHRHREAADARRRIVLGLMQDHGSITDRQYERAVEARWTVRHDTKPTRTGRYFTDLVTAQLEKEYGPSKTQGGLAVFTTLSADLQRFAERAVSEELARLERQYPRLVREDSPLQAALVAVAPASGEVLAMVGGRDYGVTQFNRAVNARRQPGSAFKPVVALAALSGDRGYTLASKLSDEPLSLETPAGLWRPTNYDGQFRGSVTLREALERSLNVPFARLGLDVGPDRIVDAARRLGMESPINSVPSLALGSADLTPLEMTRAFGVLAANGFRSTMHTTLGVLDRSGTFVSRAQFDGEQMYEPAQAYLVTSALQGAVEEGTGRRLRSLGFYGAVAAKSGTSNDYRDAWFVGYTPNLAIGVWVGFDDGRSIGLAGSQAALPIFARFLIDALGRDGDGQFQPPMGLEVVEVDGETGLRAGPGCRGEFEVFVVGTAPESSCSPYWYSARRYERERSQGGALRNSEPQSSRRSRRRSGWRGN